MEFRQSLFWDTNPRNIDPQKNARYIIERVADFGNDQEARWAFDFYEKPFLRDVILRSRCLRPRTKKLWSLFLSK